jgi:hypothetical protein
MQLVTCQNLCRINRNPQNNILTVATGIADIIMSMAIVVGCCTFTGLVSPRSSKLGPTYLKTEGCGAVSNINTRPRARMRVVVEACWGGSVHL